MARIMVLTPQLPYPPQQGTSLRNYHLLRAMALHHTVTLMSFAEPGRAQELEPLQAIAQVLPPIVVPVRTGFERAKQFFFSSDPDLAMRLRSNVFQEALVDALKNGEYDIVQIEGIELARYIRTVRLVAPKVKIILDCHNAETELQRRSLHTDLGQPARWPATFYSAAQIGRLRRFERWAVQEANAVIAVSTTDRDYLQRISGLADKHFSVIPNTIDVTEYDNLAEAPREQRYDLVFTGKMDYRPNVDGVLWFAEKIWPRVRERRPNTTWAIVGQRPHRRLQSLGDIDGITLTGRVPDIKPYLAGCQIYIVPLRVGSGTRLKLIEAMAAGCAIVSTSIGAEGFPVYDNRSIILADDPESWTKNLLELLSNEEERASMGVMARLFAANYDWRWIVPQIDRLVDEVSRAE